MTSASSSAASALKRRGLSTIQPAAGVVPEKKIIIKFSSASHMGGDALSDFSNLNNNNNDNNLKNQQNEESENEQERMLREMKLIHEKKLRKIQTLKRHLHQQFVIDEDAAEGILEFWVGRRQQFQKTPTSSSSSTSNNNNIVSKRR